MVSCMLTSGGMSHPAVDFEKQQLHCFVSALPRAQTGFTHSFLK